MRFFKKLWLKSENSKILTRHHKLQKDYHDLKKRKGTLALDQRGNEENKIEIEKLKEKY